MANYDVPPLSFNTHVSAIEFAARLNIGHRKARDLLRRKLGPGVKLGGRTERWAVGQVRTLIETLTAPDP